MKKKAPIISLLFLIIFVLASAEELCQIQGGEDGTKIEICPDLHHCVKGICVHKSIFPLSKKEMIGTILIMLVSGLANAGGSSGTALTTVILLICFNYNENKSVMIAFALVFGGALGNFLNVGHGKNLKTGRPLINYDISLICMPLMLLGTSAGIMLNRMAAPIVIAAGLAGVMYLSLGKIYKKAKKEYAQESNSGHKELKKPPDQSQELELDRSPTKVLKNPAEDHNNIHTDEEMMISDDWKKIIEEEQEVFPKRKLSILASLLIFNMLMALLKGTQKFTSILGFEYCSDGYWTLFSIGVIGCFLVFFFNKRLVRKASLIKKMIRLNNVDKGFEITDEAIWKLAKSSIVAGVVAGLLGMGGSTVMGPVLLSLGIDVQTVVATSGFFVVQTSLMALFQAILYGDIGFLEFMFFLVISFVGSYGISLILSALIKLTRRPSLILFILVFIFTLALVVMPVFEVWRSVHNFKELFTFGSFC